MTLTDWLRVALIAAGALLLLYAYHAAKIRRIRKALRESFGKPADVLYSEGDLGRIREYHDLLGTPDAFSLDEITWNDLNLDEIFKRINGCQTLAGEQMLYHMLRCPLFDRTAYEARLKLIDTLSQDEDTRLRLQLLLRSLGRRRNAGVLAAAEPDGGPGRLLLYFGLDALLIASIALACWSPPFVALVFLSLILISVAYANCGYDLAAFYQIFRLVHITKKIVKLPLPIQEDERRAAEQALKKLSWLGRFGALHMIPSVELLFDGLSMVFLVDLIAYEFSKRRLSDSFDELVTLHELTGSLDAAVCVASYREGLAVRCRPELDFSGTALSAEAEGLVHPLIAAPVPNSFSTGRPMLLTGSNASGKSTFLKSAALAAVFAQSLCLCTAESYRAPAFRVYSSMALRDDLSAGESYYIVEIRSIRRILEAPAGPPVLCVIDEVLRGTNTVERIAASSEVLATLAGRPGLCIAATHDLELCPLLDNLFDSYHFQEFIEGSRMRFDYKLYKGPSSSRNAIRLLGIMGYDGSLVESALARADTFDKTGRWS